MSFGFSVSDFVYCAQLAYKLSVEFKGAPGACRDFTKDLLIFHQLLLKTQSLIERRKLDVDESGQTTLAASAYSCKELLYVQILGCKNVPTDIESLTFDNLPMFYEQGRFLQGLRRKLGEIKFAKKIPEFQSAISARIDALTALNVVLMSDSQVKIINSQARTEVAYAEIEEYLKDSRVQANATAEQLEQGQARMEIQLQTILASQQRHATPILSHSLDASSPEGRQTWMNLGRLLRAEGITPAIIDQNRDLLVKAMRTSLEQGQSLAESIPESYQTAPEWSFSPKFESYPASFKNISSPHTLSKTQFSYPNSTMLLGSAPPRNATFSDAFLERHNGKASSLDQSQNVADGIESLFDGMNHIGQRDDDYDEGDEIEGTELPDSLTVQILRTSTNEKKGISTKPPIKF